MSEDFENEERPKIIIVDKRFSREDDDEEELESASEPKPAEKPPPGDEPPESVRDAFEVISEPTIPSAADPTLRDGIGAVTDSFVDKLTPEEEERLRSTARDQFAFLSNLGIENYLKETLNVANLLCLQYLGLQSNPNTNLTTRDLKRAGLCIDVMDYLQKLLGDFISPEESTQLQSLVASLKIEYAKSPPPEDTPDK